MKRFLTCALCFIPMSAMCDVQLWYDKNETCEGLHVLNSCSSATVTHLNVTPMADSTFNGFFVTVSGQGDVPIVYPNGDVANNVADVLRAANLGGTDRTLTQRTTCNGNLVKNSNGICVDTSGNITYVDFENGDEENGYEVHYNEIGNVNGGGDKGCQYYSKFKVQIHWCPPKYGAYTTSSNMFTGYGYGRMGWNPYSNPTSPSGFVYPELWPDEQDCNTPDEILYYDWKGRGTTSASYHRNSYTGPLVKSINKPDGKFNGWTLRGFYLLKDDLSVVPSGCSESTNATYNATCYEYWGNRNYFAKRRVITKTNTEGTARLGLPKPNTNTETGSIDLDDSHDGANGAWANTRWAVWSCEPIGENDTLHLYAGWAKDCEQTEGGTCNLAIRRTGLSPDNNKGDAFYTTTCNNGSPLTGEGTYNPQCAAPEQITYTYSKYSDNDGYPVTCIGGPKGGTCNIDTSFTLANPTNLSCSGKLGNTNYKFARWLTGDEEQREADTLVDCNVSVLAGWTDEDGVYKANISGIVCNCDSPTGDICPEICSSADTLNLGVGFTVDENVTAAGGSGTSN